MKRFLNVVYFSFFLLLFFSCNKKKDYLELIPSDTDFVIQINPKSIALKGNFNQLEQYQIFNTSLDYINKNYPTLNELTTKIKENPSKAGVDLLSPIYVFGKKENGKIISTLIMKMDDKSDFEDYLKTIYKTVYNQEIEFIEENNYTFIKGAKKPFIAWNKQQFIFIAGEYGTKTAVLKKYFNGITNNKKHLTENIRFTQFLTKSEDINLWYNGNFINYFNPNNEDPIDLSESSWANYLSFNNGNISFVQEFQPDANAKIYYSKHPLFKKLINTEFYKYFPAKSYFNFSFSIYPKNINSILDQTGIYSNQLNEYNIDIEQLKTSLDGDALFSIFDFEEKKAFNINEYFGKKQNFVSNQVVPQFVFAANAKNDEFIKQLSTTYGKKLIKQNDYYILNINSSQALYLAYKHNLIYITNNHTQMKNFILDRVEKINFLKSENAGGAKHPMFVNANLNLEEYPIDVRNYITEAIPFGDNKAILNFVNQLDNFQFNVIDEYNKNAVLNLKKGNKNSLEVVLTFLDQMYASFSNPQLKNNEQN